MIIEINNLLWLQSDKGQGRAIFLIDYGPDSDLYWVIAGDNGQIWTVENAKVEILENWTLGRSRVQKLKKKHGNAK